MIIEIMTDDFRSLEDRTGSEKPFIIDFYSDDCKNCVMMEPIFKSVSEIYEGIFDFYKINIDSNMDLAIELGIVGLPMIMLKNVKTSKDLKLAGIRSKDKLVGNIEKFLGEQNG